MKPITVKASERLHDPGKFSIEETDRYSIFTWGGFLVAPLIAGAIGASIAKPVSKKIKDKTLSQISSVAIPTFFIAAAIRRYGFFYPLIYTQRTGQTIEGLPLDQTYWKEEGHQQVKAFFPILFGTAIGTVISSKTKSKSIIPVVIGGYLGGEFALFNAHYKYGVQL